MTTDARRKAVSTYVQGRLDDGDRKATFWLTPARARALDRLARATGSRQKAFDRLLDIMELDTGD